MANENIKQIIQRIEKLEKAVFRVKTEVKNKKINEWYKSGSTIHKIIVLREEKFFIKPKNINDIILEFKARDIHLKASDLTLPLRKIVRNDLLKKEEHLPKGKTKEVWHYLQI